MHIGGNIGRSLLMDLPSIRSTDLVVLEMSSAQLEDLPRIKWAPPIAVITNLHPHHLDRYASPTAYYRAKLNIACSPDGANKLIVGDLHPDVQPLLARMMADRQADLIRVHRPAQPLDLRVPGRHNQANAACVLAVCHELGHDETLVRRALGSFAGLPHRLQHVRTLEGVDYVNDSKSTSPAATVTAIEALPQPLVAIVGGQSRDVPLSGLAGALISGCRTTVCVGESGPALVSAIRAAASGDHDPPTYVAATLDEAVSLARQAASPGDAVLFSPGAPSFDGYTNFVERGDHFRALVMGLAPREN